MSSADQERAAQAVMSALRENAALRDAIKDIDAHARPLAEDKDGFVSGGYLISIGSLHRALALTGTGVLCPECPHEASHFTQATAWNEPTGSDEKGVPDGR